MIVVRAEVPSDIPMVRRIHEKAFGQPAEAGIVDAIRTACPDALSLVAADADQPVGHILFSPVVMESAGETITGMGLAPMAVLPTRQRQGIGSRLVEAGLETLRAQKCPYVIVLGHPEYYPRFGFTPASAHRIRCQWEGVPDSAFMVLIFDPARMKGAAGVARYREEFDAAM